MCKYKKYVVAGLLSCFVIGWIAAAGLYRTRDQGFFPALSVLGDVEKPLAISVTDKHSTEGLKKEKFWFENKKYEGYRLKDILNKAKADLTQATISFISQDGLISRIEGTGLDKSYIVFSDKGWESINLDHPASSNVKDMASIVVASEGRRAAITSTEVEKKDGNRDIITPGKVLTSNCCCVHKQEGTSEKEGKSVTVYTEIQYVSLSALLNVPEDQSLWLVSGDKIYVDTGQMKVSVRDGNLIYTMSKGGTEIQNPEKIIVKE